MPSLRIMAFAVAALAASSAAAQSGVPLSASPAPAHDSRTAIPKVPLSPQVSAVRQIPTQVIVLKPNTLIARKDSVCYALRTYQFDQAASADSTNLIFKRNAALVLCRMGKTDEAIRRLRDILEVDPDDAQTLQILSVAREYELNRAGNAPDLPSLEEVR